MQSYDVPYMGLISTAVQFRGGVASLYSAERHSLISGPRGLPKLSRRYVLPCARRHDGNRYWYPEDSCSNS